MAAFELLENGLKFGAMPQKVDIELLEGDGWLEVRVSDGAIPARISMLAEHLIRIRGNAEGVYVEEMRRAMSGGGRRAMLGLARLAHEARREITRQIEDGTVLGRAFCAA